MAVGTNARIEFSVSSVEEWEKVNPKLYQGEPVFAKKPSGKYILKVGAPGGSTYKNAVVVWDQDDAETKMTSTQEAAAQALAFKNAASASASAAKSSEAAAAASKSAAATSAETAKTSETNAAASANTAKAWSMSDRSPDGVAGSKSSKTWAEEAKTSASSSASNASASAFYATNSANSAKGAMQSETASANNASAAASSASNASTSATNAKTSETNAANSAKAAAQSAENAKLFDPSSYAKYNECFPITDTGRKDAKNKITDLNDIKCISYPSWACLDSSYVKTISHCPTQTAFYLFNVRNGASSTSKNDTFTNLTSYYYYIVQLLLDIGGAMWVRTCFNSSKETFGFSNWEKVASINDIPTKTSQLTNDSNFMTAASIVDMCYPVGTVYMSADKTKTKVDFPFMRYGTWEEVPANLCLQTGNASEAGTQRSAGLPNITGKRAAAWGGADYERRSSLSGCFKAAPEANVPETTGGESWVDKGAGYVFDASLANPIYGSSTTVQPPAYMVRAWIRTA